MFGVLFIQKGDKERAANLTKTKKYIYHISRILIWPSPQCRIYLSPICSKNGGTQPMGIRLHTWAEWPSAPLPPPARPSSQYHDPLLPASPKWRPWGFLPSPSSWPSTPTLRGLPYRSSDSVPLRASASPLHPTTYSRLCWPTILPSPPSSKRQGRMRTQALQPVLLDCSCSSTAHEQKILGWVTLSLCSSVSSPHCTVVRILCQVCSGSLSSLFSPFTRDAFFGCFCLQILPIGQFYPLSGLAPNCWNISPNSLEGEVRHRATWALPVSWCWGHAIVWESFNASTYLSSFSNVTTLHNVPGRPRIQVTPT